MERVILVGVALVLAVEPLKASGIENGGLKPSAVGTTSVAADPLERIRQVGVADGEITGLVRSNGIAEVSYVLRPTPRSFIRCILTLPDPNVWDGRLWGFGNGGWAGKVCRTCKGNSAAVHCDLGTSRSSRSDIEEAPEVMTDYAVRATHLMTVSAKGILKTYYGRMPRRSYFHGSSCGGRQGIMEATYFPEDYDGVISEVPGITERSRTGHAWRREQLIKRYGTWFSRDERAAVRAAELAYFSKIDPVWARGKFILDPYPTKERLDGCWKEALLRNPGLADREALWRSLFDPVVVKGEFYAPGRMLGVEFESVWGFVLPKYLGKKTPAEVTEEELAAFARNRDVFPPPDLADFKLQGGKMIMYGGLEDLSCAEPEIRMYYDAVISQMGGAKGVRSFFAYYVVPGRSHGARGESAGNGIIGQAIGLEEKIVAWREDGVDPGALEFKWIDASGLLSVGAYPDGKVEFKTHKEKR